MERDAYIKQLKRLIKKYHPDLCTDTYLEQAYTEITIKLNAALEKAALDNVSTIQIGDQAYEHYKTGIKYYRNIHPNKFYKKSSDNTFEPKPYEEQLKILNLIFVSFTSAEYFFTKVITEFPQSEWSGDSKEKIGLLKKLYKSYENFDAAENSRIIDSSKFVDEMGLKVI